MLGRAILSTPDLEAGLLKNDGKREDEVAFREPWEAQAFALTVVLNQSGLFLWTEWAEYLSKELHTNGADEKGSDYYHHWLVALEKILVAKGVANSPQIADLAASWQRAAQATPHGKAISLENDPLHDLP